METGQALSRGVGEIVKKWKTQAMELVAAAPKSEQAGFGKAGTRMSFFSEDDLRDPPRGKPLSAFSAATGKSLLATLRHLGRIKEMRAEGKQRLYLVCC